MTVAEIAARWRVSRMTVYRMVESGALRSIRLGRTIRVPAGAVREMERGTQ